MVEAGGRRVKKAAPGGRPMYEWQQQIQIFIDEIDQCIKSHQDDALTLHALSCRLGYSEFYVTRKFREISGIQFRDYLRLRRLALRCGRYVTAVGVFWKLP